MKERFCALCRLLPALEYDAQAFSSTEPYKPCNNYVRGIYRHTGISVAIRSSASIRPTTRSQTGLSRAGIGLVMDEFPNSEAQSDPSMTKLNTITV